MWYITCGTLQVQPKDLLDYGVITELAGRIPVITTLDSLTQVSSLFTDFIGIPVW